MNSSFEIDDNITADYIEILGDFLICQMKKSDKSPDTVIITIHKNKLLGKYMFLS